MGSPQHQGTSRMNLVDPALELLDPNPDICQLFVLYNDLFFYGSLGACTVSWSKKMTSCAGICQYYPKSGLVSIRLSEPLLKLRPRHDLVDTLLHEMIHAYLFVTALIQDHDGHGLDFQFHMRRINEAANTTITIYHSFHDEVAVYKQHVWRCDGACRFASPFYGWVRRAVNRAPGRWDHWWGQHQRNCGGQFIKVEGPEPKKKAQKSVMERSKSAAR